MKKVLIFGSTGSIGKSTLSLIASNKQDFSVLGLCAYKNLSLLKAQVDKFKPKYVCVVNAAAAKKAKNIFGKKIKLFLGKEGLLEFSQIKSDISVMGITGMAALEPLLVNIEHTKRVALANKESMVIAGFLVKAKARKFKTEILPVDSEINALFQTLNCFSPKALSRVCLTASGGSLFKIKTRSGLDKVGVKDVLKHPTWDMGSRITIDSATLLNKAFEVIEAHEFFDLDFKFIDVVIHQESKVHSIVSLIDGTSFICFYEPSMKVPIYNTLYHPKRIKFAKDKGFNSVSDMDLSFKKVDLKRFSLFKLTLDAARKSDGSLAVINASDEVAIDYFLKGRVKFLSIYEAIKNILSKRPKLKPTSLKDILWLDEWARAKTKEYLDK